MNSPSTKPIWKVMNSPKATLINPRCHCQTAVEPCEAYAGAGEGNRPGIIVITTMPARLCPAEQQQIGNGPARFADRRQYQQCHCESVPTGWMYVPASTNALSRTKPRRKHSGGSSRWPVGQEQSSGILRGSDYIRP